MRFRVATYNAGLAVGVLPHSTERAPHVIGALAELDVDLLFVQEFWLETHVRALEEALLGSTPYVFRPEPLHPEPLGACTETELEPLRKCIQNHCQNLVDEALAACVVRNCSQCALQMSSACVNCIVANPFGTADQILGRCVGAVQGRAHARGQPERGMIAYGGAFGTALFSRYPLLDRDVLLFDSTINARGALYARLPSTPFGALDIFATHLSPGGSEQPPQVDRLLAWIGEKRSGPALLLGDLNLTPDSTLFSRLLQAGFREPDRSDRRATYTSTGLETGRVRDSGWRIDHVLVRDLDPEWSTSSHRVLDTPVVIGTSENPTRTTLSDHFGVLVSIDAGARSEASHAPDDL